METFTVTNDETGILWFSVPGWYVVAQYWQPSNPRELVNQEWLARWPETPAGFAAAVTYMRDLRKNGRAGRIPADAVQPGGLALGGRADWP